IARAFGAEYLGDRRGKKDDAHVLVGAGEATGDDEIIAALAEVPWGERLIVLAFGWEGDPARPRKAALERGVALELRTIPMEIVRQRPNGALRFPLRPEIDLEVVLDECAREPRFGLRLRALRCE